MVAIALTADTEGGFAGKRLSAAMRQIPGIGNTRLLSNETVSNYTPNHVAKDYSWLSDLSGRFVLTWKCAGLSLAWAFCCIVVPTPPSYQPLLAVASFKPIASRVAMLLQRHGGCVPSANDLGKARAARCGASDFLGKSILSFRDFHPA